MQTTEESIDFAPFFIVGAPRSGTTLLASCLGRHTAICATPETHFLTKVVRSPQWARCQRVGAFTSQEVADLLSLHPLSDLGLNIDDLRGFGLERAGFSESSFFTSILHCYMVRSKKAICIEKTPNHLLHAETLFKWYPRTKVFCMLRDGRDVVQSTMKMPGIVPLVRRISMQWNQSVEHMLRLKELYPEQFHIVRYEEMLCSAKDVLCHLNAELSVSFEERQLDHSIDARIVPAWEMGWKANSLSELDPSRRHAWKRTVAPADLEKMNNVMGKNLRKLGYPEVPPEPRGLGGISHKVAEQAFNVAYHPFFRPLRDFVRRKFIPDFPRR